MNTFRNTQSKQRGIKSVNTGLRLLQHLGWETRDVKDGGSHVTRCYHLWLLLIAQLSASLKRPPKTDLTWISNQVTFNSHQNISDLRSSAWNIARLLTCKTQRDLISFIFYCLNEYNLLRLGEKNNRSCSGCSIRKKTAVAASRLTSLTGENARTASEPWIHTHTVNPIYTQ